MEWSLSFFSGFFLFFFFFFGLNTKVVRLFGCDALNYGATTTTTIATEHSRFYKYSHRKKQKNQFKTLSAPIYPGFCPVIQLSSHDWPSASAGHPSAYTASPATNPQSLLRFFTNRLAAGPDLAGNEA